ncbi:MFS transporter [Rickettsia endosymbiont of Halotydeus destructor]|uniref:MFS transporter n=1 Tax=Rickettsia endosymbiont of Halotydeus destructor TaxID=2996754 RepID=UPI003BAFB33D
MLGYDIEQRLLTKEQKQAIGLLSVGTFLEYFDLMLYVHMAVLLNELFFPKADPQVAFIYSAAAFCSTYLLRPLGALIFGWIGDTIGRKSTVIITTIMMSLSCLVMANLQTYEEAGAKAAWLVTACRIVQGMACMGEAVGAELYLAEMVKLPARYMAVSLVTVFATLGGAAALGVASLVTSFGFNWRLAFWFGAVVAFIGSLARTNLRETPEFVDAKRRIKKTFEKAKIDTKYLESNPAWQQKVSKKTSLAYFLIECTGPLWFCITYIHCGNILKENFNFTPAQVIHQNLIVGLVELIATIVLSYLVYRIHPLKILKVRLIIFSIFAIISPILLRNVSNFYELFFFQIFIVIFAPTGFTAFAVFCMYFPVFKRFKYTSFIFATSRALMYAVASFGIVFLTNHFGYWGLLLIIIPVLVGYRFGLNHFKKLEIASGNYF